MRVLVAGSGATGHHAARTLLRLMDDATITFVDRRRDRAEHLAEHLGGRARWVPEFPDGGYDIAVLCVAAGDHAPLARRALTAGAAVVSSADGVADTRALLNLDAEARERDLPVVVGAAFSPGLSCLLARHAADTFEDVDEIHVAKAGTGGPACARQHHAALAGRNWDWRDGGWVRRRSRSGRQLAWFPEPIGARDCYRAALAEPLLLYRAFPEARRLTARMAATRRDRFTSWLPMLRPPHSDGGPGAVRVEVWGRRDGDRDVVVYGAADHPALAGGIVSAVATAAVSAGELPRSGAYGLAEAATVPALLAALDRFGVVASVFEGAT